MKTNLPTKKKHEINCYIQRILNKITGCTNLKISDDSYLSYSAELYLRIYDYYESIDNQPGKYCHLALIGPRNDPDSILRYCIELNIDKIYLVFFFEPKDETEESLNNIENLAKGTYSKICKMANIETTPFN